MTEVSRRRATPTGDGLVEIADAFESREFSPGGACRDQEDASPVAEAGRSEGRGSDLSRPSEPHGSHQAEGRIRRHLRESGDPRRSRRLPVAALRATALPCQGPVGSAQWRTVELSGGGQQNCSVVARSSGWGSSSGRQSPARPLDHRVTAEASWSRATAGGTLGCA